MSTPTESSLAEQRLTEIIERLEDDGWQVTRELRSPDIPTPLRNLPIDFVAFRDSDTLIGEVLSRKTATSRRLETIAKIVENIPNTELEIYWLGNEDADEPHRQEIRRYLRESRAITEQSPQASLLMAMAAFEAGLTSYANDNDIVSPGPPRRLLEHLYSLGLISAGHHALLARLYKLRSEIVHTATSRMPKRADVAAVRSLADRMATGIYASVDVMTDWLRDNLLDAGEYIPTRPGQRLPPERARELVELLGTGFPRTPASERQEAVRNLGYVLPVSSS
jgi:hypothetical protein